MLIRKIIRKLHDLGSVHLSLINYYSPLSPQSLFSERFNYQAHCLMVFILAVPFAWNTLPHNSPLAHTIWYWYMPKYVYVIISSCARIVSLWSLKRDLIWAQTMCLVYCSIPVSRTRPGSEQIVNKQLLNECSINSTSSR